MKLADLKITAKLVYAPKEVDVLLTIIGCAGALWWSGWNLMVLFCCVVASIHPQWLIAEWRDVPLSTLAKANELANPGELEVPNDGS